jgi:hypothetical protein
LSILIAVGICKAYALKAMSIKDSIGRSPDRYACSDAKEELER